MANEKRLIDANALLLEIEEELAHESPFFTTEQNELIDGGLRIAAKDIRHQPTVDAVELPCKMGDTVWGIKAFNHGRLLAKQGIVHQMFFGDDMRLCICVKDVCRGEWGKNVFATKEEAEVAIGERRTDDG